MKDNHHHRSDNENRNQMNLHPSSRSKSPHKKVNGIRLYNFSEINSYKYINKPHLSEKDYKNLNQKLNLYKEAQKKMQERVKINALYINYEYNPFSKTDRHHKSDIRLQSKTQRHGTSLIDAMSNKKIQKKTIQKQHSIISIRKMIGKYENLSQVCLKSLQNKNVKKVLANQYKKRPREVEKERTYVQREKQLQFDDIVKIKQQSFFKNDKEDFNLFKVLFGKNLFNERQKIFQSYKFSHNSVIDKYQKFRIFPIRDISIQARSNVKRKEDLKTTAEELDSFRMQDLRFDDLMNIATGKTTADALYKKLMFQAKLNQLRQNDEISLRANHQNKSTYLKNQIHQRLQKEEYLQIQLSKHEKRFKNVQISKRQQIAKELQCSLKLIKSNIHDKKLHKKVNDRTWDKYRQLVDQGIYFPKNPSQKNKVITDRKQHKDRTQMIKMTELIKSFIQKKEYNKKVQPLIANR